MAVIKKEVEIAKELDDCLALVIELVKDLKAKKALDLVLSENLPGLMNALGGIDQIGDELKLSAAYATIGLRVGELAGAFIEKPAAPQA